LAVGLFNPTEQPLEMGFKPRTFGFFNSVTVRDLWRQKDLETVEDKANWSVQVAPHGVQLLKLTVRKL
jgi:hypothetical protein